MPRRRRARYHVLTRHPTEGNFQVRGGHLSSVLMKGSGMVGLTLVTGAGGFIGGQMESDLEEQGNVGPTAKRNPIERLDHPSDWAQNFVRIVQDMDACCLTI